MSEVADHTSGFFDPKPQPFYAHSGGQWRRASTSRATHAVLPCIKLFSWNIDCQMFESQARMTRALEYLHELISALPTTTTTIIHLQEMTSSDLQIIQETDWVQLYYHITDINTQNWLSNYGTITLVDRRLHISNVFRIPYRSDMGRDALFVEIEDSAPTTLRFCNTHLESLKEGEPLREPQMKLASRYLKDPTVDGGVIAGDFNAIGESDATLHEKSGLKDAFLEGGGEEGSEEGMTWGMHYSMGGKYPLSRMDKMFFCGKAKVENYEKMGAGIKIDSPGRSRFVTDHLGLMADMIVDDNPM
ncbi:hypothetical protein ACLMJK_006724 [Lecanora helva]